VTGRSGGNTDDSLCSTSWIRSAQTAARGAMINKEGRHHHRHQDLIQVGQEGRQRSDLHITRIDTSRPKPQHRDTGCIEE
jgi:hypothetical protein